MPELDAVGTRVGEFARYRDAVAAVEFLAARKFPVYGLRIVGCELRLVEQVVGRRSRKRAALGGVGSGLWFGLLAGVLFAVFATTTVGALALLLWSLVIGACFGGLFGLAAESARCAGRNYLARDAIVPSRFELLADPAMADRAREHLDHQTLLTKAPDSQR